jgi:hypothetical protein
MAKQLKDILAGVKSSKIVPGSTGSDPGVDYAPKAPNEQKFVKKHSTEKHADRVGNGDDVYQATNVKHSQVADVKHGYKKPEDKKVNEAKEQAKCNMTEAGTSCPVHEMADCSKSKTLKEVITKKTPAGEVIKDFQKSDNPKFAGKSQEKRKQMALAAYYAKQRNEEVESVDEAGSKQGYQSWPGTKKKAFFTNKAMSDETAKWKARKDKERAEREAAAKQRNEEVELDEDTMSVRDANKLQDKHASAAQHARKAGDKKAYNAHMQHAASIEDKVIQSRSGSTIAGKSLKAKSEKLFKDHPYGIKEETEGFNSGAEHGIGSAETIKEDLAMPLLGGGDDESAEMAKTQLRALANKALHLAMQLSDDQVVEPWVQSKIAVAKDHVTAVHDYMVYGDHSKDKEDEQTAPYDGSIDMSGSPRDTFPNFSVDVNTGRNV